MTEIEILTQIYNEIFVISKFLQLFVYGFIVLIIIYFGYWFFSRFFYKKLHPLNSAKKLSIY